jgi:hypothetical protein
MQSRSSHLRDVLTSQDVNELADTEPDAVRSAVKSINGQKDGTGRTPSVANVPTGLKVASIGRGGNVEFQDTDDFKSLTRSN